MRNRKRIRPGGVGLQRLLAINSTLAACLLLAPSLAADRYARPPLASAVTIERQGESHQVVVKGGAGAVEGGRSVILVTVDTGHFAWVPSASDGSFTASLLAPRGTAIQIKASDSPFIGTDVPEGTTVGLAGTMIRTSDPVSDTAEIRFAGAGLTNTDLPMWTFTGAIDRLQFSAGETLTVRGTIVIDSPVVATSGTIRVTPTLMLERLSKPDGTFSLAQSTYSSSFMTPTGFPIERRPKNSKGEAAGQQATLSKAGEHAEAFLSVSLLIPGDLEPGYFRPYLGFLFEGLPKETTRTVPMLQDLKQVSRASRNPWNRANSPTTQYIPIIRIGDPTSPRIPWTLFTDELVEGARGTGAIEDRQTFGFVGRVVAQPATVVLPRLDESGTPIRYRLEPHLPAISISDRGGGPNNPLVPFRFPSGSLRATVTHPDGTTTTIGPAPFVQARHHNATGRSGRGFANGGGHPTDPYALTTLDPRFELAFQNDGRYVVRLEGDIEDIWGHRWIGEGTYEFWLGASLVIDTAMLPGTPLEAGQWVSTSLQIIPPVEAEVEIQVTRSIGGDVQNLSRRVIRGRANRFGSFVGDPIPMPDHGEFRVDATATWRDRDGRLFMGSRSWGSIVGRADSPIVAHGRRGIDGQQTASPPTWFTRSQTGAPIGSSHLELPFLNGDVQWAQKGDAVIPQITFQDAQNTIPLLQSRGFPANPARHAAGETPLFSSTPAGDPQLFPDRVDLWGYAYRSIQRPLVRVREIVGEEEYVIGYYWRFSEAYGNQKGVGRNGDLPNDFKFQFGGVVLRGSALAAPQYAMYGSLFVLVPDDDTRGGSRVFPPFQGNGGGPDGGPLFTLRGKKIDLFFHPTAVRAGTILHRGELVSFSGYSAPTLASRITITVQAPSGEMKTIEGQASVIGWFSGAGTSFAATETGLWKAKTKISFEGRTSSGQVTAPFPAGDVLGSRDGEFWFYVVEPNAPPLQVTASSATLTTSPAGTRFVRPADGPVTFTVTPPAGLTNLELHTTTTMPGFILEEKSSGPGAQGSGLTYVYDAPRLAKDFPNLDLHDADGFAGVDTITISFFLSGTDTTGTRRHFARQVVIQGEELQMPEQKEMFIPPRRRSARR